MPKTWMAGLALLVAAAGAWALKVGDTIPASLVLKPLNRTGDAYDLVKETKGDCGVLFVNPATADNENTLKMIALWEKVHRALDRPEKPSGAALVMVCSHDLDADVRKFVEAAKLTVPVAVMQPDELTAWELPDPLKAIAIGAEDGKVKVIETDAAEFEKRL